MRAIILAAGLARRFADYLGGTPKCLLRVAGVPLLLRQIKVLKSLGIDDIVIVKGHASHRITVPGTRSYFNARYATSNMVASLFCAKAELVGDVIVSYGDIIYEARTLARLIRTSDCPVAVAVDVEWQRYYEARFGDPFLNAESLIMDEDGRLREIGKSQPSTSTVQGQYIGLIKLNPEGASQFISLFDEVRSSYAGRPWMRGRSLEASYMTDFLQALIDRGVRVCGASIKNGWLEFDTVNDYEKVLAWYKAGTLSRFLSL